MYLSTDSSMIHKAFQLLQVSRWWILHLKALLKMQERNIQTSNYVWLQRCSDGEGRAELSRGLTGTGWLHRLSYANGWNDSTAVQRLRSHTHTFHRSRPLVKPKSWHFLKCAKLFTWEAVWQRRVSLSLSHQHTGCYGLSCSCYGGVQYWWASLC